jgi:subtilase family serine protease
VLAAAVSLSVTAALGVAGQIPASAAQAGVTPLASSAPSWTAHSRVLGALPSGQTLQVRVWLASDTAGATAFANAVSNPKSASYRHFLSPAQYTARFGATAAAASATSAWLRSQGLTSVSVDRTRAYVTATGSAAVVDRAFAVREDRYQPSAGVSADGATLYANNRAPSVPTALASDVLGITGLDNIAPPSTLQPSLSKASSAATTPVCSKFYGQRKTTGPELFGSTTFALAPCGYSAAQMRSVYSMNNTSIGTGVTVAVIEQGLATDMFQTLRDYANHEGMPAPVASRYTELSLSTGQGGTKCGDPFAEEEQLDVEMTYDMAPGANILVVGGNPCITSQEGLPALLAADQLVLDGSGGKPLASVISNSWDVPATIQTTADANIEHSILLQAAAEGASELFSTGDAPGVDAPSNDPYATAIGGTTVGIGKSGQALFTTGWSDQVSLAELPNPPWETLGIDGAGGGGASPNWQQPSYQSGVVPDNLATVGGDQGLVRTVPDISASANEVTPVLIGLLSPTNQYETTAVGGTSEASPLMAGMIADAEQGSGSTLGFLNPLLYSLSGSSAITDVLGQNGSTRPLYRSDVTCDGTSCAGFGLDAQFEYQKPIETVQVTQKGYDTMTGLGTPNGQAFISALRP